MIENSMFPSLDSLKNITVKTLNQIKLSGFFYFKIDEKITNNLSALTQIGKVFFHLPENEKKVYPLDENYEGYLNHKDRGTEAIQRYAYRGGVLPKPFSDHRSIIDETRTYFQSKIALPMIKKIFDEMGMLNKYDLIIKHYSSTLSFIYYPSVDEEPDCRLKAHKDIDLVTILFINEPGLEVYVNHQWHKVDPKLGYVVVNIGDVLELMTGKTYPSSLHRVKLSSTKGRLSISTFLGPNPDIALVDYTTGESLYANFAEFFEEKVKLVYPKF